MALRNASTAYAGASLSNLSLDDSSRWVLNSMGGTQNEAHISGLLLNKGSIAFERDRLPSLLRAAPSFSSFSKLTTHDLDGNGTFYMGVDIARDQADSLIVTGTATGSHSLYVTNSGAEPTRERMQSHLVEAANGDAQFSLGNRGGFVEAAFTSMSCPTKRRGIQARAGTSSGPPLLQLIRLSIPSFRLSTL